MLEPVWMWGILGLALLAGEMLTAGFYLLWFGIAALLIAVLLWLFPGLQAGWQLFLFALFSFGSLFVWRRYYRKNSSDLLIGQSQGDAIGRTGIIVEPVGPRHTGRIRFAQGVMGSREWSAVAEEEIETGAPAAIVGVEGNSLRVKRHSA